MRMNEMNYGKSKICFAILLNIFKLLSFAFSSCIFHLRHGLTPKCTLYCICIFCVFFSRMSRKNVKYHVQTVHENKKSTKCVCEVCGIGFPAPSNLAKHAATHSDQKVQCDICGEWRKHQFSLQDHKARAHKQAPQRCPYCDTLTYNPNEMKIHISQFHKAHKHQCSICKKSFARPVRLKVSLNVHSFLLTLSKHTGTVI